MTATDRDSSDPFSATEAAKHGWASLFPQFKEARPKEILDQLVAYVEDASSQQIRAWDDSIPLLQTEAGEILDREELARKYSAILEYELPLESRRPDVVLLVSGAVRKRRASALSRSTRPRR